MAIKTTWTEVNQIIKEEFQRVMEKKKIQSRIQQINEELAMMEDEDSAMMKDENLEEVEAGSEMKVRSHAWTGEEDGDTKWTPEFEHKGSALMEEDEIEVGDEDDDTEEEGSLADEFAELGAAIEAKIMAALGHMNHEASETPEEEKEEDDENSEDDEEFEEVEVSDDENEDDTMGEYREVVPMGDHGVTTTHDMDQDGKEEGDKEGEIKKESMNESVSRKGKKYLNVLSEGMDSRRQSALEGEIERMRKLAKLGNND
jgi:hypothetical protein